MQASIDTLINNKSRGLISLEINPPHGVDITTVLEKLRPHVQSVDYFNVTDCALAKLKLAALPFAAMVKGALDREVLVNVACRDRNSIAMQADLLAAWACGVRSIVALTGDALSAGDFPDGKAVFEMNSIGLLQLVAKLNAGADSSGKELKGAPAFINGAVVNPNARNLEAELKRALRKRDAGAKYFLSQPVFDLEIAKVFLDSFAKAVDTSCMLGVAPIKNARALEGIQKVPGIKVGESFLKAAGESGDLEKFSKDFCSELYELSKQYCTGVHVIAGPNPTLAMDVTRHLAELRES